MPIIEPDLGDLKSNVVEPGAWPSEITEVKDGISGSGNKKIVVFLDVTAQEGRIFKRQAHLVTQGTGAFTFESLLRACHFDDYANALRRGERSPFDTDKLVGQQPLTVFEADLYNGQPSDKIKSFLPK